MNNHCKIGKVTLRNGAIVHILNNERVINSEFVNGAIEMSDFLGDKISGFVTICWDEDKNYCAAYDCSSLVISPMLIPSYIKDIMLSQITENRLLKTFNRDYIFGED